MSRRAGVAIAAVLLLPVAYFWGFVTSEEAFFPSQYILRYGSAVRRAMLARVAPSSSERVLQTAYVGLSVTRYFEPFPRQEAWVRGGGIDHFRGHLLVATGDGLFQLLAVDETTNDLESRALDLTLPFNDDHFRDDVPDGVPADRFRVTDLYVDDGGESVRILVSHHYWKAAERRYVLRISQTDARPEDLLERPESLEWTTLFETRPSLPIRLGPDGEVGDPEALPPFAGEESGGRIQRFDDSRILFTVGDHAFTAMYGDPNHAQEPDADYGKTLLIDLHNGDAEVFTIGHRNPQGLHVTEGGEIWLAEHGPQGGDELNLLVRGGNYGWPLVTYGTDYGSMDWPLSVQPGSHDGFVRPIFSWIPSIGIGNLIEVKSDGVARKGDLLVASLTRRTLFRVRVREGRVVYVEPIELGVRIRDLIEMPSGKIVLLCEFRPRMMVLEPVVGELNSSALLFTQCTACHGVGGGGLGEAGPALSEIVGSRIASSPTFPYSVALRAVSGRWTQANLDSFLADPEAFAPGTTMVFDGVSDADDRAALIDYLGALR